MPYLSIAHKAVNLANLMRGQEITEEHANVAWTGVKRLRLNDTRSLPTPSPRCAARNEDSILARYCPHTWDGWQCWPPTPAATEAERPCPSYSYLGKPSSCPKLATKQCTDGGRWLSRVGKGGQRQEWSNYSSCSVAEGIIRRLYVHIGAYAVSVVALLPALVVFFSYKQLRVHRITLHKHLFISLLLEASGVIILRLLQLHMDTVIKQNQSWCIALSLVTKYGRVSNYMWYLCEGYYLHRLLASAFAEQSSLGTFYFIGWDQKVQMEQMLYTLLIKVDILLTL
nr:calcitonin gene-related peptide type 1 receptor-like [Penaeus vannamei]